MEDSEEKIIDIREYWHIIKKRCWTIFTVLIILVSTVAIGLFFIKPTYKATTVIQVERENPKILSFEEIYGLDSYPWTFYQTQLRLIKSRSLAKKVIDRLGLLSHPELTGTKKIGLIKRIKEIFRFSDGKKNKQDIDPYSPMINVFLSKLVVELDRDSQIISISFIDQDAKMSADVANAVAEAFIETSLEAKYITAKQAYDFLNKQIKQLMKDIELKEGETQKYAQEKDILSLDDDEENITVKQLIELNAQYTIAQAKRIEKEAVYNGVRNASADSIPEAIRNPLIQELKVQYASLEREYAEKSKKFKSEWPEMIQLKSKLDKAKQRLAKEINDIVRKGRNAARAEYQAALQQELSIKEMLDQQKDKMANLHKNSIIYNNLKTEVDNKRALLQSLIKRQNEAGVSADLKELGSSYIRIVDKAEIPRNIYKPNKKLNILLSMVVGLMLGIGLALFLEYLDNSLKTRDDVERYIKLPTIGIIPSLNGRRKPTAYSHSYGEYFASSQEKLPETIEKIMYAYAKSPISEAYKSLRTSILLSSADSPPKTILVTSSQPREGKTASAINIAIALSQLDKKVLLLETDLRKPRIAKSFKIYSKIGISNFLSGDIDANQIIYRTSIPNLFIIPSGPIPPNPAELLATAKMDSLLEGCKKSFSFIVLDSPPILVVTDAQLLANKVDGVVLVVYGGMTPKDAVKLGKEKLQNCKIIGVVLNQIDLHEHNYYYKHYYSYNYYYTKESKEYTKDTKENKEKDTRLVIRLGKKN